MTADPGDTAPFPAPGTKSTVAPGTGRPASSTTRATTGNVWPGAARRLSPQSKTMESAASAGVSAVALTSADGPSATRTASDCDPAAGPNVHDVAARPSASVSAADGLALPPPPASKVTAAPANGAPPRSSTRTTTVSGSMLPCTARWPAPDSTATVSAACRTVTGASAANPAIDARNVPVPLATAVTTPSASTVNTAGSLLVQLTVPSKGCRRWSVTTAATVAVSPRYDSETLAGRSEMSVARGGSVESLQVAKSNAANIAARRADCGLRGLSRPVPPASRKTFRRRPKERTRDWLAIIGLPASSQTTPLASVRSTPSGR